MRTQSRVSALAAMSALALACSWPAARRAPTEDVGDLGSDSSRYACLASNPAKGITPGRVAMKDEMDKYCPQGPVR